MDMQTRNPQLGSRVSEEKLHLVGFRLGDQEWAIEITRVREILKPGQITPIPDSPPGMVGVIHLRGHLVPVMDLGACLGLGSREQGKDARIMVVSLPGGRSLGLLVDAVTQVLRVPKETLEPPPQVTPGMSQGKVQAICKLQDRLILLVDPEKLFAQEALAAFQEIADAMAGGTSMTAPKSVPTESSSESSEGACDEGLEEILEAARAMANGDFKREIHKTLYGKLGELAQYINTTLKKLQFLEPNVKDTTQKIPQASFQLSEITKMTAEATHRIMGQVEQIQENHRYLQEQLQRLEGQIVQVPEALRTLQDIQRVVSEDEEALMEVMTGLSFQDLTGQKIKRIIEMVEEIEKRILQLLITFGIPYEKGSTPDPEALQELAGTSISQDRVDELLRQFGF